MTSHAIPVKRQFSESGTMASCFATALISTCKERAWCDRVLLDGLCGSLSDGPTCKILESVGSIAPIALNQAIASLKHSGWEPIPCTSWLLRSRRRSFPYNASWSHCYVMLFRRMWEYKGRINLELTTGFKVDYSRVSICLAPNQLHQLQKSPIQWQLGASHSPSWSWINVVRIV